ncbi:hypothetical protein [Rhodoferax sp. WC2427]|uniref:hypothetical protein n=1 Tax=Rhodoferax sp. WC2427 TaxID=3234144 RepID=UPI0034676132
MPVAAFRPESLWTPRYGVALALVCCDGWVLAQEADPATATAPQLEIATLSAPSLQRADPRLDSRLTVTGWSGPAPQAGIGLGMGFTAPRQSLAGDTRTAPSGLDLGLHWRSADAGQGRVRIGVWQHLGAWPDPTLGVTSQMANPLNYNTRLEMQFSAASARGIQFELGGALGLQLNPNEKVVLRLSRGRPMVYYRLRF